MARLPTSPLRPGSAIEASSPIVSGSPTADAIATSTCRDAERRVDRVQSSIARQPPRATNKAHGRRHPAHRSAADGAAWLSSARTSTRRKRSGVTGSSCGTRHRDDVADRRRLAPALNGIGSDRRPNARRAARCLRTTLRVHNKTRSGAMRSEGACKAIQCVFKSRRSKNRVIQFENSFIDIASFQADRTYLQAIVRRRP